MKTSMFQMTIATILLLAAPAARAADPSSTSLSPAGCKLLIDAAQIEYMEMWLHRDTYAAMVLAERVLLTMHEELSKGELEVVLAAAENETVTAREPYKSIIERVVAKERAERMKRAMDNGTFNILMPTDSPEARLEIGKGGIFVTVSGLTNGARAVFIPAESALTREGIQNTLRYKHARWVTDWLTGDDTRVALNPSHYARHFAKIPESCFEGALGTPITQTEELASAREEPIGAVTSGASAASSEGAGRAL